MVFIRTMVFITLFLCLRLLQKIIYDKKFNEYTLYIRNINIIESIHNFDYVFDKFWNNNYIINDI